MAFLCCNTDGKEFVFAQKPYREDIGDYIIKDINGEFYSCKPDIFDKTYEEVTE